jgi:hypothetical protein
MVSLHLPQDFDRVGQRALVNKRVMRRAKQESVRGSLVALCLIDRLSSARALPFGRHDVRRLADVDRESGGLIDHREDLAALRKSTAVA